MSFLLRWAITATAAAVATWIIPGIQISGSHPALTIAALALVLGFINAFIRPIISALSCGLIVMTLGLFTLVINGLMLWLASWITESWLGREFHVAGFWSAFWGALIISVISVILSTFVGKERLGRA